MRRAFICIFLLILAVPAFSDPMGISIGSRASSLEKLAAKELQRYLYHISGELLPVEISNASGFLLGTPDSNHEITRLAGDLKSLGEEGYRLKRVGSRLVIAANTPRGVLYGVYALLEEYGVGFSLGGDALPRRQLLRLLNLDISAKPALKVRGVLPWYNFFNSPTAWNPEDYRAFFDNLARMKMNFIGFHTYDNEPYAAYTWDGKLVGGEPLANSMQSTWGTTPMKTSEFAFGTDQFFDGSLFGAETAIGYATREEGIRQAKAVLRDALGYAKGRGLMTCVGFEVHWDPTQPDVQQRLETRLRQLLTDYPMLDYVWIWESEALGVYGIEPPAVDSNLAAYYRRWSHVFSDIKEPKRVAEAVRMAYYTKLAYDILKRISPQTRLIVAGWGGDHHLHFTDFFPGFDRILPEDIIFSALDDITTTPQVSAAYARVKRHEKWPVPWFEYDGDQWQPQPKLQSMEPLCRQALSDGCQGMLGIHWRTRAVEEAAGYLARFAWEPDLTRERFLRDWAKQRFGADYAPAMARILLELDGLGYRWIGGSGQAECGHFSWGPGNDTRKKEKLIALGEELDRQIQAMQAAGDLGAADRAQYIRRTIDWVLAYNKAALALQPGGEADQLIAAWEKAPENEKAAKRNEALKFITGSGLDKAMQILSTNLTNRGELGVLATVNLKAFANYRARLQKLDPDYNSTLPSAFDASHSTPPRVLSRMSVVQPGESIRIRVLNPGMGEVSLAYRAPGEKTCRHISMEPVSGYWFEAVIPGNEVKETGIEYYISSTAPNGKRLYAPAAFPAETFTAVVWQEPGIAEWKPALHPKPFLPKDAITELKAYPFRVTLGWKPAPGAAAYQVYRAAGLAFSKPPDLRMITVRDNWYEDRDVQPQTRYCYWIAPVGEDGNPGPACDARAVSVSRAAASDAPKGVSAVPGPQRIVLTWDSGGWNVAGYRVYRITPDNNKQPLMEKMVSANPYSGNRFVVRSSEMTPCRYQVRAVYLNGAEGPAADTTPVSPLPEPPSPVFRAKADESGALAVDVRNDHGYQPASAKASGENWCSCAHQPWMNFENGMTISVRVRLDNVENMPVLLAHGTWEQEGYFLQVLNGRLRFHIQGVGTLDAGYVPVGKSVVLTGVYNGVRMEGYIDGQHVGGIDVFGEPVNCTQNLFVGRYAHDDAMYYPRGRVESAIIYDSPLEPDEIAALALSQ